MKRGFVPKRLLLIDIQTSIAALWKAISTPEVSDLPSMTLAQLNAHITDADVDDDGDPRSPTVHASSHYPEGSDDLLGRLCISDSGMVACHEINFNACIWNK